MGKAKEYLIEAEISIPYKTEEDWKKAQARIIRKIFNNLRGMTFNGSSGRNIRVHCENNEIETEIERFSKC